MALEVALLDWSDTNGMRLLGRSRDPAVIETVRDHLAERLGAEPAPPRAPLRVVTTPQRADPDGELDS